MTKRLASSSMEEGKWSNGYGSSLQKSRKHHRQELYFDRGNFYDFTSLVCELDLPGDLYERKTYLFKFSTVEMPYESYSGANIRLRYILKVTVSWNIFHNIVAYRDFVVRNYTPLPSVKTRIKMEVGIEDCLHIEFEYNKSKYHLRDVIIGKIYFLIVRIKIKNMELEIRHRESRGAGSNTYVDTETLAKFELMDGASVRARTILYSGKIVKSLTSESAYIYIPSVLLCLVMDHLEGMTHILLISIVTYRRVNSLQTFLESI